MSFIGPAKVRNTPSTTSASARRRKPRRAAATVSPCVCIGEARKTSCSTYEDTSCLWSMNSWLEGSAASIWSMRAYWRKTRGFDDGARNNRVMRPRTSLPVRRASRSLSRSKRCSVVDLLRKELSVGSWERSISRTIRWFCRWRRQFARMQPSCALTSSAVGPVAWAKASNTPTPVTSKSQHAIAGTRESLE